ncbi:hypothetical protein Tco_0450416 [Tanacetum coccineum]
MIGRQLWLTETFSTIKHWGDGSSKKYKILSEMLLDFDRMDVEQLFRLVKERYSSSAPEGFDLMLWGDLHTLFEPDEDDEIWKDQHEYNLLSWRLHDFCGLNTSTVLKEFSTEAEHQVSNCRSTRTTRRNSTLASTVKGSGVL